jgi:poly(3-hydroxybutyrate) depolymerase
MRHIQAFAKPARSLAANADTRTIVAMRLPIALPSVALTIGFAATASAATTVPLPTWMCGGAQANVVFLAGFEADEATPHEPSNGSGGEFPGDQTRVVQVPGGGAHALYLHIPPSYSPTRAMPVLLALHGTAGAGAAPAAAQQVRSDWSGWSDDFGFIVIAPVASGAQGSWDPDSDIPVIFAALDDTGARYDVEQTRITMWGFSAGGHLAHALALNHTDYFSSYGVSAGALTQYACSDNGSPPPSCATLLGAAQPKIPVDIFLGNQDPLYLDYGAGGDPSRFEHNGWVLNQDIFYTLFSGGHEYTVAQLGAIWTTICPFALGP